ncbi:MULTISPECIES: FixH family protein [Flammeovirga]|uniref:Nitrogen fixation protein FixH n=1 Tax=Flammeovirga agarivorans TaxID=2726742 RepID=A0A7X8SGJ8_9BACT|nr:MULTISPECIES: FixH family protein [Flammeovirga]NLR89789.1 hypothetical protein [Flammeovirga agarivorans]
MKLNWGWGVVIAFVVFGTFIIAMVIKMFTVPVNMVSKDYYAEEQLHEIHQKQKENINTLSEAPVLTLNMEDGNIDVILPPELKSVKGQIRFFRPSDNRLDFNVPLKLNEDNAQSIDASRIMKGRWILKMSFSANGKEYLFEKALVI